MSEEKDLGGRPPHEVTDETRIIVRELYSAGIPRARIASRLDINEKTLNKHYKAELDETKDAMTARLGSNLYQDALAGKEGAREFWLKCQGRWSYAKPDDDKKDATTSLLEKIIEKL